MKTKVVCQITIELEGNLTIKKKDVKEFVIHALQREMFYNIYPKVRVRSVDKD